MRKIEFRGKLFDEDIMFMKEMLKNRRCLLKHRPLYEDAVKTGWIKGYLTVWLNENDPYIIGNINEACEEYADLESWWPVKADTVGQYTGRKDIKNKRVYEDDIVKGDGIEGIVYYDEAETGFMIKPREGADYQVLGLVVNLEVIGNIYDTPELFIELPY